MERIISKLAGTFVVVLLLLAAAIATANAQTAAKSSYIYGIGNDGTLKWYRHDGADRGLETAGSWQGANQVGSGWNGFLSVFPGGQNIIYLIRPDGILDWRQHQGARAGLNEWGPGKTVGTGWNGFEQVFSGGGGIIYIIEKGGKLRWYNHKGYLTGEGTPGAWEGPKEVGRGWADFKLVFPGGNGIIYAITNEGKLLWYKHNGYQTGAGLETPGAWEGPKEVGRGWADFKTVFSASDGIIYAITNEGKLLWYKHNGYQTGAGLETPGAWEGPKEVGHGWGIFVQVFALLPGSSASSPTRSSSYEEQETISSDSPVVAKDDRGTGATARARPAFQPENTIKVSVRYKKEFGYVGDSNAFGYVGPTSCNAFSVSVVVGDGSVTQKYLIRISSDSKMEETGGYYFCHYLVSEIPLNQPTRVSVRLAGPDQFAAWKGGSQGQPPPGQQRTIIIVSGREGDPMTLTATQPRARQLFEMVYTSSPR